MSIINNENVNNKNNNDKIFMPLNISYGSQKSGEKKLLWFIICSVIFIIMLIIIFKVRSDFFYSDFLSSQWFLFGSLAVSIFIYSLLIRKLVIKENKLMKLYEEALKHEMTSINDLWEIYGVKDDVYSYYNNTFKIFVKCEKGYVVSRPPDHEVDHRNAFKIFIRQLIQHGYGVEYYNYHINDANTKPLEEYQELIRNNPNPALRRYGAELLRECREFDFAHFNSEIEYFVITAYSVEESAFLRTTVENAALQLEGSLYVDVSICSTEDVIEFLELNEKVSGVNFTELMNLSRIDSNQRVVKVVKVLRDDNFDESVINGKNISEEEEELAYIMELENKLKEINRAEKQQSNLLDKYTPKETKNNNPLTDAEMDEQLNYNKTRSRLEKEELLDDAPILIEDDEELELVPEEVLDGEKLSIKEKKILKEKEKQNKKAAKAKAKQDKKNAKAKAKQVKNDSEEQSNLLEQQSNFISDEYDDDDDEF